MLRDTDVLVAGVPEESVAVDYCPSLVLVESGDLEILDGRNNVCAATRSSALISFTEFVDLAQSNWEVKAIEAAADLV